MVFTLFKKLKQWDGPHHKHKTLKYLSDKGFSVFLLPLKMLSWPDGWPQ